MTPPALLVVGVGNPSRGDDAVGPLFIERLAARCGPELASGELELMTDFQLQIEHALDLVGRERVVFVDARADRGVAPFTFESVPVRRDDTYCTHAMSPSAVLETHQRVVGRPPEAWQLGIRGEQWELGDPLSAATERALEAALAFFVAALQGAFACAAEQGGARFDVQGVVQGVGFRPWLARKARALGLGGSVYNTSNAAVVQVFGARAALDALEFALRNELPWPARADVIARSALGFRQHASFEITPSVIDAQRGLAIPADLSVCAACLKDVDDPSSRFAGYAFTSCSECGPRFSSLTSVPYDRARTTLAGFGLCAACDADYRDPQSRRFHAESLACPSCGPRLWLVDAQGSTLDESQPLMAAARMLLAGHVLAVRGLGGFHFACDATNALSVAQLRARKQRDAKPFAVMVADLAMAERCGVLETVARAALCEPARPIVLVERREGAVCAEVSGASRRIGLMLPYTPLHHLLLERIGRPLVMTSGNLAGEPIAIDNDAALRVLGSVADALLLHDRPIARRVEDSVLQLTAAGPHLLRRSRGHAPRHIRLPVAAPEPVLAVGGQLKNTVCIVVDDRAYMSPHLGDLGSLESERAWSREVLGFEQLLRVQSEVIAHDLHPDYVTTRLALQRTARVHHGVQHHVAHVLAAVAELHLDGPVLGVVFDGSGWGPDGTSWGGEFLLVEPSASRWQRVAALRPLPLPGGEAAIRDVRRQALALLFDAFGDGALDMLGRHACFADLSEAAASTLARMIETRTQTVGARGLGRYFDAVGALILGMARAHYEGQVALALEEAASEASEPAYPWAPPLRLATTASFGPEHELDLRPTTRALTRDLARGVPPRLIAARFHATIVAATLDVVARALAETGARHVVFSGGALQNRKLATAFLCRLGARAQLARELPVNDGGLALGQALSAVLALRQTLKSEGEACVSELQVASLH